MELDAGGLFVEVLVEHDFDFDLCPVGGAPVVADPIDLAATLLTHCGESDKFAGNHEAIMSRQNEWMATARKATQAQRTRWSFGSNPARWRA